MKSATISDGFKLAVGDRKVRNAFFSTYCLEPDFFELYIIPLFLQGAELSTDETIRHAQLQHFMGSERFGIAVAHDCDVVQFETSPFLEVDYLPIRAYSGCQHAKIAVIEVEDSQGRPAIILAAGSFNLTRAGWWQNIEVGHWIELSADNAPRNIVRTLRSALEFFRGSTRVAAISALINRLDSWKLGSVDTKCEFYFSHAGARRRSVPDLLRDVSHRYIEIVSPFFSDDGANRELTRFLTSFERVWLLAPKKDGVPTMTEAVYTALKDTAKWCQWHESMLGKERELEGRVLHAKIFAGEGWQFVGSVNLSFKALHQNVEAGFLLTERPRLKLLQLLKEEERVFAEVNDCEEGEQDSEATMPPIMLTFDWQDGQLGASCPNNGVLTLFNQEGVAYPAWRLEADGANVIYFEGLDRQLKHSALVRACWTTVDGATSQPRNLIISQHHVYCRPTSLPEMDIRDLLRIFQGMKPAARSALIEKLAAVQARSGGPSPLSSNEFLPAPQSAQSQNSFFSEFSQVNGAFWTLKKKLEAAKANGNHDELRYYLVGEQPDSLRGLARALAADDRSEHVSTIVRYVTLLSMAEILDAYPTEGHVLHGEVTRLMEVLENGADFNSIDDKVEFVAWIKEMFSKPMKQTRVSEDAQEPVNE